MRIESAPFIAALAVAAQGKVVSRDPSAIVGLLTDVFNAMTNADNHILEFEGGDITALRQSAVNLYDVIDTGVAKAQALAPLTLEDVAQIADISRDVTTIGSKFLEDLAAAAPVVAANGLCEHAYQYSISLGQVSNDFFTTAKSKFPVESQDQATQEIDDTNSRFSKVQSALAPGVCVDKIQPTEPEGPSGPSSAPWNLPSPRPGSNDTRAGRPIIPVPESGGYVVATGSFMSLLVAALFSL